MIPLPRFVRRLLIAAIALGLLFTGANILAARIAEDRIAEAAQKEFDLRSKPRVEIGGFPILLNVLRGELPKISFDASDVPVEGLVLRRVEVRLAEISVSGLFGGNVVITVGNGAVLATIDDAALNAFLRRRGERATVHLLAGGKAVVRATRRILGRDRTIVARGTVRHARGEFVFTPTSVTVDGERPPPPIDAEARRRSTIRVRLPKLPGGFEVQGIQTAAGTAQLLARLRDQRISLS